ncbi:MAG: hypothetical protein MZU95_06695 [Desulfomicrobium escambiense]|nr:hypothetical protein [Desulfomicrobium escambiense]
MPRHVRADRATLPGPGSLTRAGGRDYGGRFATCICCMDGRIQLPLLRFIQDRYKVRYVDIITEPGPIQYLAGHMNHSVLETIRKRLHISVDVHDSGGHRHLGALRLRREPRRQARAMATDGRLGGRRPGLGVSGPNGSSSSGSTRTPASEGRPLARPPIAEVHCGRGPHPVRRSSSGRPG